MYGLGAMFFGSQFQAALLQTGAFEIYIDGELAFSKLQTGRQINNYDIKEIFGPLGIEP